MKRGPRKRRHPAVAVSSTKWRCLRRWAAPGDWFNTGGVGDALRILGRGPSGAESLTTSRPASCSRSVRRALTLLERSLAITRRLYAGRITPPWPTACASRRAHEIAGRAREELSIHRIRGDDRAGPSGPGSPATAHGLMNRVSLRALGRSGEALAYDEAGWRAPADRGGRDHTDVATRLNNWALLERAAEREAARYEAALARTGDSTTATIRTAPEARKTG